MFCWLLSISRIGNIDLAHRFPMSQIIVITITTKYIIVILLHVNEAFIIRHYTKYL
jgi:hypothetical protein